MELRRVEHCMHCKPPHIAAPADSTFEDLRLRYEAATSTVSLVRSVLISLIEANRLDVDAVLADDQTQRELIHAWYSVHIDAGGAPDPVMELVGNSFFAGRSIQ